MATLRFLLRRFAAQRLLGLAVVVTLAFSVGVLVAGPIYAVAARAAILSSSLAGQPVTVTNARYQVYGDAEFDWAGADEALTAQLQTLPLQAVVPQGLATVRLGAGGPSVSLLFRDGSQDHLTIHGDAPGRGEVLMPAGGTAGETDIKVGDTIDVVGPRDGERSLVVSGTYELPTAQDPFWFGTRSPFPGPDATDPPPLIVDRETFLATASSIDLTSLFVWDAYLDLAGLPYDQAVQVPDQIRAVADAVRDVPGLATIRVGTGLDTILELVSQRVADLQVPILLVVFQIGAVTLAVLAGVGALTLTRQSFELAVLHSRGFSRRTLLAAQGLQAVLAAAIAYPLGLVIGVGLAKLAGRANGPQLPGVVFPVTMTLTAALLGVVAAVAGAAILLLLSVPLARRTVLEERRAASREERPLLARVPVELFVLPLGIFAFIQLRHQAGGDAGGLDPLVLAAPTLLLFGLSFLALRLLLWGFRALDRPIGRARRLPVYLSGRRLGRSPGTGFAAALLLLLATGLLVLSTSYRAVVLTNHADAAHTQVGADWNVAVAPPAQQLPAIATLPGTMTPVVTTGPSFSSGSFSLPPTAYGIDPASFGGVAWWRNDYSATPLPEILDHLRTPALGAPIDPGKTLNLKLDGPPNTDAFTVTATVEAADGTITTARPQPMASEVRLELDEGGDRLLSITFQAETGLHLPSRTWIQIDRCDVDGSPVDLHGWVPITWRGSRGRVSPSGDGVRYSFRPGAGNVIGGIEPPSAPLPALVSDGVADQVGSDFTVLLAGQSIPIHTIARAAQFPSALPNSPFFAVSVRALLERQLAIPEPGIALSEVWAVGKTKPTPTLRRLGFTVGQVQATAPIEGYLAQLPQSLAVGMNFTAAVGGLALVVLGVAAGLYFSQRRRDYEFAALRAMGVRSGQIRRTLLLEQGLLLGFAIVAGLALGYLLLRLMMPSIGLSLGVPFPPPRLVLDWRALGIALAAVVVATGFALWLAVRSLMRSSVTGVLRGEAE
jgi:putative ABC transport system permease protein